MNKITAAARASDHDRSRPAEKFHSAMLRSSTPSLKFQEKKIYNVWF